MKSIFAETDQPAEGFASVGPQGESTAEECLAGAGRALEEAIQNRRIAYERLARWKATPGNTGEVIRIHDALKTGLIKRGRLNDQEISILTEHEILQGDRCRTELEVQHQRDLVDWWRARAALGDERTYGRARSGEELVRAMADGKVG